MNGETHARYAHDSTVGNPGRVTSVNTRNRAGGERHTPKAATAKYRPQTHEPQRYTAHQQTHTQRHTQKIHTPEKSNTSQQASRSKQRASSRTPYAHAHCHAQCARTEPPYCRVGQAAREHETNCCARQQLTDSHTSTSPTNTSRTTTRWTRRQTETGHLTSWRHILMAAHNRAHMKRQAHETTRDTHLAHLEVAESGHFNRRLGPPDAVVKVTCCALLRLRHGVAPVSLSGVKGLEHTVYICLRRVCRTRGCRVGFKLYLNRVLSPRPTHTKMNQGARTDVARNARKQETHARLCSKKRTQACAGTHALSATLQLSAKRPHVRLHYCKTGCVLQSVTQSAAQAQNVHTYMHTYIHTCTHAYVPENDIQTCTHAYVPENAAEDGDTRGELEIHETWQAMAIAHQRPRTNTTQNQSWRRCKLPAF